MPASAACRPDACAQVAAGRDSVTDIYSTGKSMFLAMIMVVTCEIGLVARYWTTPFVIICFLSYALVSVLETSHIVQRSK
jgi:hypothetical protein